jgi:hypothetical protein
MSLVGFEPTTPEFEMVKILQVLDLAQVIGSFNFVSYWAKLSVSQLYQQ